MTRAVALGQMRRPKSLECTRALSWRPVHFGKLVEVKGEIKFSSLYACAMPVTLCHELT